MKERRPAEKEKQKQQSRNDGESGERQEKRREVRAWLQVLIVDAWFGRHSGSAHLHKTSRDASDIGKGDPVAALCP